MKSSRKTRRLLVVAALVGAQLMVAATAAQARPGRLEDSWGSHGVASVDLPGKDFAVRVASAPGGKTVVAAYVEDKSIAVIRLTSAGRLDATFSKRGVRIMSFTNYAVPVGLLIGRDGSIFVAAMLSTPSHLTGNGTADSVNGGSIALIKLRPNGTTDTAFGTRGVAQTGESDVQPLLEGGIGIASDAHGSILLLGVKGGGLGYLGGVVEPYLARFSASGKRDRSFGVYGVAPAAGPAYPPVLPVAVAVQHNGRIIVGGWIFEGYEGDFVLYGYLPSGLPDPTFGVAGVVRQDVSGVDSIGWDRLLGIVVQRDDKILSFGGAPGSLSSGSGSGPVIARLNSDGRTDATFATGGVARIPVKNGLGWFTAAATEPDGRIVAAGSILQDPTWSTVLVRFESSGRLDRSFGRATTPLGYIEDIADESDRIVVTGQRDLQGTPGVVVAAFERR